MMKTPARRRSSIADSRSRKRKKPKYTKREPPAEERERLWLNFERFNAAGKDNWPVEKILRHRPGRKKNTIEYQVQWADHPETGEIYAPQWLATDAISEQLIGHYWATQNTERPETVETQKTAGGEQTEESQETAAGEKQDRRLEQPRNSPVGESFLSQPERRRRALRTLPDSSSEPESPPGQADTVTESSWKATASHLTSPRHGQVQVFTDSSPLGRREGLVWLNSHSSPELSTRPEPEPEPVSVPEPEPEPERKSVPGSVAESARTRNRSPSNKATELYPSVSQKSPGDPRPSSLSLGRQLARGNRTQPGYLRSVIIRRPSYSPFTASSKSPQAQYVSSILQGSKRVHRQKEELYPNQDRRVSVDQAEEARTPATSVSSSQEPQSPLPAEPPPADTTLSSTSRPQSPDERFLEGFSPTRSTSSYQSAEQPSVNSPTLSPVSRPLDWRSVPNTSLPGHRLPVAEVSRRFWNPAYRPAFLRSRFLAGEPAFGLRPLSYKMDLLPSSMVNPPEAETLEPTIVRNNAAQTSIYDVALGGSALPIQDSIEEEEHTSNGEQFSSESKASSSQQSIENERDVPQGAGLVQPSWPILGPAEYAIALPCEGKIQSTYSDIIKDKEKSIKKFLGRNESTASSNGSPNRTQERNEMNELIQRLHDTVTHMDLGLPGISTQYSIESQELAAYANYAGSKFSFLGHLVDMLKNIGCSIIIMAREGAIQDLLEQYLKMKHVIVKRQDRIARSKSPIPDRLTTDFQVELVSTWSTHEVAIYPRPVLMIAFDASFDSQDPQVARIRSQRSERQHELMPVLHLLVANSSEHVDRCLPKNMPSSKRLKLLVRATYQAWPNLGGQPLSLPRPSDEPEGRPMDLADLQQSIRKGLERRLVQLARIVTQATISPNFDANWKLGLMRELQLQLTELEEAPVKRSGATTRAETPKEALARSRTPISRADTPSGRKRLLEVEGFLPALQKRQRLTPLRDSTEASGRIDTSNQLAQLQDLVKKLEADLETEREGRRKAEQDRDRAHEHLAQWKQDHADLQRRYEKRMTKCHELENQNKKILKTIENNRTRNERIAEDDLALKQKNAELQKELAAVRAEIKAGGGDAAAVEVAREEARTLLAKNTILEKSLENTRKDFEFTRTQYQEASNKAADFANQIRDLEEEVTTLTKQAGDEKRRLRETNYQDSIKRHLAKISEMELERKSRDMLLRKLEEENRHLKRNRGIQTRGSSVQPPGSPGLDGHSGRGTRSRQGSPAPGLFANSHHSSVASRGSLLRHER